MSLLPPMIFMVEHIPLKWLEVIPNKNIFMEA
jgi:hypothetical protein